MAYMKRNLHQLDPGWDQNRRRSTFPTEVRRNHRLPPPPEQWMCPRADVQLLVLFPLLLLLTLALRVTMLRLPPHLRHRVNPHLPPLRPLRRLLPAARAPLLLFRIPAGVVLEPRSAPRLPRSHQRSPPSPRACRGPSSEGPRPPASAVIPRTPPFPCRSPAQAQLHLLPLPQPRR